MKGKETLHKLPESISPLAYNTLIGEEVENMEIKSELDPTEIIDEVTSNLQTMIEVGVDEHLSNLDLSDYIDINDLDIDYDDIRYNIEDDIFYQINDHIDTDTIRYEIEDDILSQVDEHIDFSDVELQILLLHERIVELEKKSPKVSLWSRMVSKVRGWF